MNGKLYSKRFDKLQDFISDLNQPGNWGSEEDVFKKKANSNASARDGKNKWAGSSYDGALKMLTAGWKTGRVKMEEFQRGIKNNIQPRDLGPQPFFDVTGEECDIGRYCSFDPENMLDFRFEETNKHGRIIKIMVQGWVHAGAKQTQMLRRGAAAIAIADALENAGYRVELELYFYNRESSAYHSIFYVPVKAADQNLQIDRLTYLFCHVSVMRRLWFRIAEQMQPEDFHNYITKHYGTTAPVPKELMQADDIWITTNHLFDSDSAAVQFINQQLEPYSEN